LKEQGRLLHRKLHTLIIRIARAVIIRFCFELPNNGLMEGFGQKHWKKSRMHLAAGMGPGAYLQHDRIASDWTFTGWGRPITAFYLRMQRIAA
jgi:hypothetical protein